MVAQRSSFEWWRLGAPDPCAAGHGYAGYPARCARCGSYQRAEDLPDPGVGVGQGAPAPAAAGGLKYNAGKPKLSLVDSEALTELGEVLTFGAQKYASHNWRKGIPLSQILDALMRHVAAYNRGEDVDPESGRSHMAHAMCNAMFALWMQKHRPDLDDRFKAKPPAAPKEP